MKHAHRVFVSGLTTILVTLSSAPVQAQNLYRYVNEEGNTVLSGSLPPNYADKGYEIIDKSGRVIQFVSPKLSQQQLQALEVEADALRRQAAQEQRDRELLLLYGSAREARDALNRQMDVIKGQLALSDAEGNRLRFTLKQKQEQISKLRQFDRKPPEQLTDSVETIRGEIRKNRQKTSDQLASMEDVRQRFLSDIARLEELRSSQNIAAGHESSQRVQPSMITGDWQIDARLDWTLSPDGSFRSVEQQLDPILSIETLGLWKLDGSRLTISADQLNITDSRGKTNRKRVAQEQRGKILAADEKQLTVILDGITLKMGRP